MKATLMAISLVILNTGCALTHPGSDANVLNSHIPMKISAQTVDLRKEDPFQLIEVTIENTSGDWLRIDQSEVVLDPQNKESLSVVVGNDLKDWAKAMQFRLTKEQHNAAIAQLALITSGAVMVNQGKNGPSNTVVNAGAIAALGGYAWATIDTVNAMYTEVNGVAKTPTDHLYSSASVPGKMFIRKWVLLNTPADRKVNKIVLKFKTVEGEEGIYAVNL